MKAVVVYNSQTSFTERYARWIAEATGAEWIMIEMVSISSTLQNY